jgi:gamma-glutamylcyclotransferase (GGCT)/AIG2-like uncharacterized protein YtfP
LPYIFGYGSLIEQASRMKTTPQAMYVLPARARGFARGWWARTGSIGFTTTFVGAIPGKSKSVNGVIYAVSEQELEATNKREQGYTATDITSDVEILSGGSTPKDKVWIYVNDFKNEKERQKSLPTPQFPIVQSYVDICLTGCLQIEQGFPEAGDFAGSIGRMIAYTRAGLLLPSRWLRTLTDCFRSIFPSCSLRSSLRPGAGKKPDCGYRGWESNLRTVVNSVSGSNGFCSSEVPGGNPWSCAIKLSAYPPRYSTRNCGWMRARRAARSGSGRQISRSGGPSVSVTRKASAGCRAASTR